MDMQGTRQLGVTQEQAWEALNDPQTLKGCLPGCDKFESTGENQYAVTMAVKVGPVSAKFNGKVTLSDIQPPASYKLAFEGQGGVAGFGKGASAVSLTPNDAGCELAYTVQAQARRERMIEHFDQTEASLARLRGPIGIYIGSKTPPEIAVSVMAEILAVKNAVRLPREMDVAAAKDRQLQTAE